MMVFLIVKSWVDASDAVIAAYEIEKEAVHLIEVLSKEAIGEYKLIAIPVK